MKATIKEIHGVKDRTGPNGVVYFFTMTMSNGDKVNVGKKSRDALQLGTELDYEVVSTDEYGTKKIKEIKDNPFQAKAGFSKNYEKDAITMCMSFAKDIVVANMQLAAPKKIDLEETAEKIYNWVIGKLNPTAKKPIETDGVF